MALTRRRRRVASLCSYLCSLNTSGCFATDVANTSASASASASRTLLLLENRSPCLCGPCAKAAYSTIVARASSLDALQRPGVFGGAGISQTEGECVSDFASMCPLACSIPRPLSPESDAYAPSTLVAMTTTVRTRLRHWRSGGYALVHPPDTRVTHVDAARRRGTALRPACARAVARPSGAVRCTAGIVPRGREPRGAVQCRGAQAGRAARRGGQCR